MTVEEIKRQADDQIVYTSMYMKGKAVQQRRESLRIFPRKSKIIRANKKWTSARKGEGRSTINAINIIPIQPPSARPDIFVFGLTKK